MFNVGAGILRINQYMRREYRSKKGVHLLAARSERLLLSAGVGCSDLHPTRFSVVLL